MFLHSRGPKKQRKYIDDGSHVEFSRRRGWRAVATVAASLVAFAALGTSTVEALGGFNAVIGGNGTFASGSIVLEESGSIGSTPCYSTGSVNTPFTNSNDNTSCTTVDTFGAASGQLPGVAAPAQTLTFTNKGTSPASSFTMATGTCSAAGSGSYYGNDTSTGFCGKLDITISNSGDTVCYYPSQASACPAFSNTYTVSTLHTYNSGSVTIGSGLAAGASTVLVVNTELDSSATNSDMGLSATVPFTWTLNQ